MKTKLFVLCLFLLVAASCVVVLYRMRANSAPVNARVVPPSGQTTAVDVVTSQDDESRKSQTPQGSGVSSGNAIPQGLRPEAAAMLEKAAAERKAKAAQYQDALDFIRNNPNDPNREKIIDSIIDPCISGPIANGDAAYVLLEKHKYEVSRGKFYWLYISRASWKYELNGDLDKAIGCLQEGIRALQTEDYHFDGYGTISVNTPEAKNAVIEDLQKRIRKLEQERAESRPAANVPRLVDVNIMPGQRIAREPANAAQKAQQDEVTAAVIRGDNDAAIKIYESMGDRENAASLLLNTSRDVGLEAGLRVVDEVERRYPGTVQAGLAEFRRAELYHEAGQEEDYTRTLKEYISKYPESPMYDDALRRLAGSMQIKGQNDEAIGYYEQLLDHLRRSDKVAFLPGITSLAALYEERGNYDKTDKLLTETIAAVESGELSPPEGQSGLQRVGAVQALRSQLSLLQKMRESRAASTGK